MKLTVGKEAIDAPVAIIPGRFSLWAVYVDGFYIGGTDDSGEAMRIADGHREYQLFPLRCDGCRVVLSYETAVEDGNTLCNECERGLLDGPMITSSEVLP